MRGVIPAWQPFWRMQLREGGILNIRINLTSIQDRSFKKKMEGLVTRLQKKRDQLLIKLQ